MYCRNCGEPVSENVAQCSACKIKIGEGVDYCHNCGGYTTERTEFCRHCGAKLKTMVPKKIKEERYKQIEKQVNVCKKIQGILKFLVIGSSIITVILIVILIFREQPNNIPSTFYTYTLEFGQDKIYQPSDYMNYADANVQEYWEQSRQLVAYIVICLMVFIGTALDLLFEKRKYKKLLKILKEQKNVL